MQNPGSRLTSRNRLARMLMDQESAAPPIQSHTQGLASMLRQGLAGYMRGADSRDANAARSEYIKQLTAGDTTKSVGHPGYDQKSVTTLAEENAARAMAGMEGNEYASQYGQQAALAGMSRKRSLADQEKARQQQLADRATARQNQLQDATTGFERSRILNAEERENDIMDKLAELQARDSLARGRSADEALRDVNLDRAKYGLAPLTSLPGSGGGQGAAVPAQQAYPSMVQPLTSETNPTNQAPQPMASPKPPKTMQQAILEAEVAKTTATEQAKLDVEARAALPGIIDEGKNALSILDQIATFDEDGNVKSTHPGFSDLVGIPGWGGITDAIPYIGGPVRGTDASDMKVLLNQVQGKQFLQAYESLKGAGQITEVEGKKAEQSIARMDAAQSEKAFLKGLKEFRDIIYQGVERARNKVSGSQSGSHDEDLLNKYAPVK